TPKKARKWKKPASPSKKQTLVTTEEPAKIPAARSQPTSVQNRDTLGYSQNSKAYIVLNKHSKKVKESLNMTFDETPPPSKTSPLMDDDSDEEEAIKVIKKQNLENDIGDETLEIYKIVNIKESSNKTAKDLWDALARHMLGFEYGKQDKKATVLYEYETFKATDGELLLDTYIRYLQVINDLKKCGYSKDNCELNFKFLNNIQPEWKQYATMMRQNKNLLDINIDALYNIFKQNQGDLNDSMKSKKKAVMITFDPLALVNEQTKVSKRKEKVVVSSESEGSDDELKKITALLAKAFNRNKFYSKPTNNNLRTSSATSSANKKQEYVKSDEKKEEKKVDEKKRDMSKVNCYNCNRALLRNFVEKFLRTVRFGNNDFAMIAGYGDVVIRSMTIKKVYYVEGLGHNLFRVGQFCDKGLEVAFRKFTCFVRNEDGVDLFTDDRSLNLYTIALKEVPSNSSACLLVKASSS
nr:integrase, catalytic region, zinc finger, CCHC-type, peptidase aspartic, catalytic [Tanacetum cinerariifolium]